MHRWEIIPLRFQRSYRKFCTCSPQPPPANPNPPPCPPPPKPTKPKKPPTHKRKSLESSSSSLSDLAIPRGHGKEVKGKQPQQHKRREEPSSLEGDESLDPLLGAQVFVPYTEGFYLGVVTTVVGGAGGRVWVEQPGENEIFRVERHLLYASHASTLTHWEQQKAAAGDKKASKAKKKPNPQPNACPPAQPAPKPAKHDPKPEGKQAPQP